MNTKVSHSLKISPSKYLKLPRTPYEISKSIKIKRLIAMRNFCFRINLSMCFKFNICKTICWDLVVLLLSLYFIIYK